MPEHDETIQPAHIVPLDDGGYGCPVPGAEAEELRRGIEALEQSGGASGAELRHLLDRVDARDSLAWLEHLGREVEARTEQIKREGFQAIQEAARVAQDRAGAAALLAAIQAVQETSADNYAPGGGSPRWQILGMTQHVNRHQAAITACEDALREHLSARERWRLLQVLIDMHADPLERGGQSLDDLITESKP